ncbi:S-methyl-5'-thioadenosine phosphorylase [Peptococcaceae bacterium]|nr:S-methyl-5'-thioadenosine phosphorylase [Peptococcaceae bacterium]
MLAIIGGTGVYNPDLLANERDISVSTPYGDITVKSGDYQGQQIIFMNRHGAGHSVPPHLVNYRANIAGLKKLGVKNILATAAVGSLNPEMKPGDFVLVDQFLDFTKCRQHTFFEGGEQGVVHVDVTDPYCPQLRRSLAQSAGKLNLPVHQGGVYVTTEGPRYETPAEIKMYRQFGGDLVGMTGVPEVVLAREAAICYAVICMVTNQAAGISPTPLTHQEVLDIMAQNAENMRSLLLTTIAGLTPDQQCACQSAVDVPIHQLLKG